MRTPDLWTGKTKQEEVEDMLAEEDELAQPKEERKRLEPRLAQEAGVTRWLGLTPGPSYADDIRIAVHPKGHAVVMLINTSRGEPYSTREIMLSRHQWTKLVKLVREEA